MSKKAKPKSAPEGEDAEGAKPKSRKKLVIVAVLVLALGAGGGWFFLRKPAHDEHAETKRPVAFMDVAEMVVNLASEPAQDRARFLKLKVALEVKDDKVVGAVQPLLPRVEDIFQVFVRELRASDLEGSGGIHRLREELLRRVNIAVSPNHVDAVLFKEVIVQ